MEYVNETKKKKRKKKRINTEVYEVEFSHF